MQQRTPTGRGFHYDVDADALYIYLSDTEPVLQHAVLHNAEVAGDPERRTAWTLVDLDGQGRVRGIEIIGPARGRWPMTEIITRYHLDVADAEYVIRLSERAQLFRFHPPGSE